MRPLSAGSDPRAALSAMHAIEHITADSLVQAVIERYPHAVVIFARHGLPCAGCYISPFHPVADSAREYGVALGPLLRELNETLTPK